MKTFKKSKKLFIFPLILILLLIGIVGLFVAASLSPLTNSQVWSPLLAFGLMSLFIVHSLFTLYVIGHRIIHSWVYSPDLIIDTDYIHYHNESLDIRHITSVSFDRSLLGHIFGYGDVIIRTTSEDGGMCIRYRAKPEGAKMAVMEAMEGVRNT